MIKYKNLKYYRNFCNLKIKKTDNKCKYSFGRSVNNSHTHFYYRTCLSSYMCNNKTNIPMRIKIGRY